jgi:hypothetical protein
MRAISMTLLLCTSAFGCSGKATEGGTGSVATSGQYSAPALLIGELTAQQFAGSPFFQQFIARFRPEPESDAGSYGTCAGAAQMVGDCCYFPPLPPSPLPATQPPGSASAVADQNAGVITFVDTTSRAQIGTFNYVTAGYDSMEFAAPIWRPGDILTVRATGDQVSAFTVSAPALILPIGQIPSSINLTQDFQITWQPDPNADIMNIWISVAQSADVKCTLPDANGSVTVAASLLAAAFQAGDASTVSLGRVAQRDTQTSTGTVEFSTFAYSATVQASVQ